MKNEKPSNNFYERHTMIDTTFNVYEDAHGHDPDTYSEMLNHYHFLLWNKPLPSNKMFNLEKVRTDKYYLKYTFDDECELLLSSDSIIHPFNYWASMQHIIKNIPSKEILDFHNLGATIGGYIIFPAKRINNKPTINAARGFHPKIRDRFDLTLECIRLWYKGELNPLYNAIERYCDFFNLFVDFKGYVEFFLLQDLVDENIQNIQFWLPFENFNNHVTIPRDVEEYQLYMKRVMKFTRLRNDRINQSFI